MRWYRAMGCLVVLGGGCFVDSKSDTETSTGTGTGTTTTSASTEPEPGSSTDATTSASSTAGFAESGTTGTTETCPAAGDYPCSTLNGGDGCAEGFKCAWFDLDEANDGLDTTACVPIPASPVPDFMPCEPSEDFSEVCSEVFSEVCSDPCGAGSVCRAAWGSEQPLCLPYCETDYSCADEALNCLTCAECAEALCFPLCDPLAPADRQCPPGLDSSCFFDGDGFTCTAIPAEDASVGDPCSYTNQCSGGSMCLDATLIPGCDAESSPGCCAQLCRTDDPDACPNPEHVCNPLWNPGQAPPSQQDLGFCGAQQPDPCETPGNCPPEGADPTYDWCSPANEAFCSDGAQFGFEDYDACVGGCWCTTPCSEANPCPTPATGNATPECRTAEGMPATCVLPCSGEVQCPDGMACDEHFDEPLCIWINQLDPQRCD